MLKLEPLRADCAHLFKCGLIAQECRITFQMYLKREKYLYNYCLIRLILKSWTTLLKVPEVFVQAPNSILGSPSLLSKILSSHTGPAQIPHPLILCEPSRGAPAGTNSHLCETPEHLVSLTCYLCAMVGSYLDMRTTYFPSVPTPLPSIMQSPREGSVSYTSAYLLYEPSGRHSVNEWWRHKNSPGSSDFPCKVLSRIWRASFRHCT